MQTFLPYSSFTKSARSLDYRRLGKQRVECLQILNSLNGEPSSWRGHPAVRMWEGYELNLLKYGLTICHVWIHEMKYNDTCYAKMRLMFAKVSMQEIKDSEPPPWLGNADFHLSHQSNLVRKKPDFYGPQFPGVPDNLPYIWPV